MNKKELFNAVEKKMGDKSFYYALMHTDVDKYASAIFKELGLNNLYEPYEDSSISVALLYKRLGLEYDESIETYKDLCDMISDTTLNNITVANINIDCSLDYLIFYKVGKEQEVFNEFETIFEKRKQDSLNKVKSMLSI